MQQDSPLTSRDSRQASLLASEDDVATPRITRKSHRKSRAGCKNCKARRIKCDEGKPHCANCKRRQAQCEYPNSVTVPLSGTGTRANSANDLGGLPISEIELTFHWTTSTCHSLSAWSTGAAHWHNLTADVAFKHQHLLHLIFAFSALHLSYCRPARRQEYVETADHHYARALALVTPEIANITPDNCDAVLMSVQMICFISWARGPQPGEYLAFGDHGKSEWLAMFRGVRTTMESISSKQFKKTLVPAKRTKGRLIVPSDEPYEYEKQLQELRAHIEFASEPSEREDDLRSLDVLLELYANRYEGKDGEYHLVFGWLYRMSIKFLERLQERDSIPLVLFAHFIVLMHDIERFWYMEGWTHHVMSGIFGALPEEYKVWVRWPMASVGWIAP